MIIPSLFFSFFSDRKLVKRFLLKFFFHFFILTVLNVCLLKDATLMALPEHLRELYNTHYSYSSSINKNEHFSGQTIRITNTVFKKNYGVSGKPIVSRVFLERANRSRQLISEYSNLSNPRGEVVFDFKASKQQGVYQVKSFFLHSVHGYNEHVNDLRYRVVSVLWFGLWGALCLLLPLLFIIYPYVHRLIVFFHKKEFNLKRYTQLNLDFHFGFLMKASPLFTKLFLPHNHLSLYYKSSGLWKNMGYQLLMLLALVSVLFFFKWLMLAMIILVAVLCLLCAVSFMGVPLRSMLLEVAPYLCFLMMTAIFLEQYADTAMFAEFTALIRRLPIFLILVLTMAAIPYPLLMLSVGVLVLTYTHFLWWIPVLMVLSVSLFMLQVFLTLKIKIIFFKSR